MNQSVLVIGAGIAGIQASIDLAQMGFQVYLVERTPSIGGRMAQLDKTFPTNDCALCILAPKMIECAGHENVHLFTYSEVISVERVNWETGKLVDWEGPTNLPVYQSTNLPTFRVRVRKRPRYVDVERCTGCGECVEKCPRRVPDEFNVGLSRRRAIYLPFPQAVPRKMTIDADHCLYLADREKGRCRLCEEVCQAGAIDWEQQEEIVELDVGAIVVATGLPMIATMLAQRTHAPNILIIFEAGGVGPHVPVLPISVGDSRTFHKAVAASSMHDVMCASQAGYIDYGFLGAAAIDAYGNINTTVIGDWEHPKVRLPGSGGANDVGSFCWQTLYIMRSQSKRTFMKKLDFLTTPGWLGGPGQREEAGLPAGGGPYRVITQLGVYGFDESTKRLKLLSLHPGVTVEEIQANSGFDILISEQVPVTQPPTEEERRILREIDPTGMVIGK